jgi:hypothetical protein
MPPDTGAFDFAIARLPVIAGWTARVLSDNPEKRRTIGGAVL